MMTGRIHGKPQSLDLYLPLLPMLADGRSNREIGREIGQSEDNAKWRVARLCWLLGASNRVHAVSQAYRRRLLDLDTGRLTDRAHRLIRNNQQPAENVG